MASHAPGYWTTLRSPGEEIPRPHSARSAAHSASPALRRALAFGTPQRSPSASPAASRRSAATPTRPPSAHASAATSEVTSGPSFRTAPADSPIQHRAPAHLAPPLSPAVSKALIARSPVRPLGRQIVASGAAAPETLRAEPAGAEAPRVLEWRELRHLHSFGGQGSATGKLAFPRAVAVLPNGVLCVGESGNQRISVVSPQGGVQLVGDAGTDPGQFDFPVGLSLDDSRPDALLVADRHNGRVQRLSLPDGAPTHVSSAHLDLSEAQSHAADHRASRSALADAPRVFDQPYGVCSSRGAVYVTDCAAHRVVVLRGDDLSFMASFGRLGPNVAEFDTPRGICAYADELYVADSANHRVHVLGIGRGGARLSTARMLGEKGSAPGQLRTPCGVSVVSGRLAVCEYDGARVQLLTLRGAPLQCLLFPPSSALGGICAEQERVHVADAWAHQVHTFALVRSVVTPAAGAAHTTVALAAS